MDKDHSYVPHALKFAYHSFTSQQTFQTSLCFPVFHLHTLALIIYYTIMETHEQVAATNPKKMKKKMGFRSDRRNSRISFSATLPDDACGVFADNSICAVLYSNDPFADLKESILEMIREVGVCDWKEMEELVYCYVAVNSSDVHRFISDAFLSIFT